MPPKRQLVVTVALFAFAACAQPPVVDSPESLDTRAEDAATIHALVKTWSAAAQARDVDTFAAVYADDAVLMIEGVPDAVGVDAIREGIGNMMQDPNFDLSFVADKVKVARSGDMAFETGAYSLSWSDSDGDPTTQTGSYVVVWEKQADGTWKVVIDAPVSDPATDTTGSE